MGTAEYLCFHWRLYISPRLVLDGIMLSCIWSGGFGLWCALYAVSVEGFTGACKRRTSFSLRGLYSAITLKKLDRATEQEEERGEEKHPPIQKLSLVRNPFVSL